MRLTRPLSAPSAFTVAAAVVAVAAPGAQGAAMRHPAMKHECHHAMKRHHAMKCHRAMKHHPVMKHEAK